VDALLPWWFGSLVDALPPWSLGSLADVLPSMVLVAHSLGGCFALSAWSLCRKPFVLLF